MLSDLDDLVASLRQATPLSRISADAAHMVFEQLFSVGYRIVKPALGSKLKLVESDEEQHSIIRWLQDTTPLGALASPEAAHVFGWLTGTGWRIQKPDRHPSGLATTEAAHTVVKRLGAGSAYHVIDRTGMPDDGVASTFNGGQSK